MSLLIEKLRGNVPVSLTKTAEASGNGGTLNQTAEKIKPSEKLINASDEQSVTVSWNEHEATVMVRETMAVYRGVKAPGASCYHSDEEKKEYWDILEQIEQAGEKKDMGAIRKLCRVLRERGKLPRLGRWEMRWLGYEYRATAKG